MLALAIRRILATIPVMAVVAIIVFSLLYLTPGDPAAVLAGEQASIEDINRLRSTLGLDQPFLVRFSQWIGGVLQGDLGISIFSQRPVMELIVQRLEPTIALTIASLFIAVTIAVPLGVIAAWRAGGLIDRMAMSFRGTWFFNTSLCIILYPHRRCFGRFEAIARSRVCAHCLWYWAFLGTSYFTCVITWYY